MLSDGHALYTPGLSENRGGTSSYMASDVLGNLWFMDNASAQQTYYQDTTAFGWCAGMGIGGTEASGFKFGGGNGCQTDADTGLVLMGHRYYDTRIGRFISQDPIGAGTNWYAYAGNNPINKIDPLGLDFTPFSDSAGTSEDQIIQDAIQHGAQPGQEYDVTQGGIHQYTFTIPDGSIFSFMDVNVLMPPGANINNNMNRATNQARWNPASALWFMNQVRNNKNRHLPLKGNNASWDYKQLNRAYGPFANINFGAAAAAMADQNLWDQNFVLRMAGWAQQQSGTSQPQWGSPLGAAPYGDDPADQSLIKTGWNYYYAHPAPDWP